MMRLVHSIVFVLAAVSAACTRDSVPAAGDTAAAGAVATGRIAATAEPTANDISNYELDMDRMRKYAKAIQGFSALATTDSAAAEAMASNANESTARMIAKLESSPAAMNVLRNAGLTPRDYVWITAAYLQAAMSLAMLESNKAAKLPEGQNPQNLEFLREHKAEIDSLTREMGGSYK